MKPRISLIVPVYNMAKYLPRCLDSALGHAFENIEVIAVDDASTDGSPSVLAKRAAADPRLKVITRDRNGGTLAARLTGLRAALGDYIAFMDQDDRVCVPVLEKALETAEKNQADIVAAVQNQRLSVAGVDMDEEAMNLVRYQNSYNLAAKVISTMTELYDRLINYMGA